MQTGLTTHFYDHIVPQRQQALRDEAACHHRVERLGQELADNRAKEITTMKPNQRIHSRRPALGSALIRALGIAALALTLLGGGSEPAAAFQLCDAGEGGYDWRLSGCGGGSGEYYDHVMWHAQWSYRGTDDLAAEWESIARQPVRFPTMTDAGYHSELGWELEARGCETNTRTWEVECLAPLVP